MPRYQSKLVDSDSNDVAGRVVRLDAAGKSSACLRPAIPGQRLSGAEAGQVEKNELNEVSVSLRLTELRKIDNDVDLQREFIGRRMGALDPSRINIVVLRVKVARGQRVEHADTEYMWDLLQVPENDLIVPPLLNLPGRAGRLDRYLEFLRDFVEEATSATKGPIGASVPGYTHHSRVRDVLDLQLENGATFILHDLGGRIAASNSPVISAVLRSLREHSLDGFFLYGFDPKPYKQGRLTVPANDLSLWAMGYGSIGPRHTVPPMPANIVPTPSKSGVAAGWARILSGEDFGYHRLDDRLGRRSFIDWLGGKASGAPPTADIMKDEDLTKVWTRAHNRGALNKIGSSFERQIREQTLARSLRRRRYGVETLRLALRASRALYRGK